ncbi:MAG: hypothetical protein V3V02_10665 [Rhizobiaceae bacterium]
MPLHILAILVVFGLAVIIGAVHFAGGSKLVPPLTSAIAIERFSIDFPNYQVSDSITAEDGKSVLLLSDKTKSAGLVVQMGNRALTRLITAKRLSEVSLDEEGLNITLRDFTLPNVTLKTRQADDIHRAEDYLDNLKGVLA